MKQYLSLVAIIGLSLASLNAEAVNMAAQPVVGDTLNGVAVALQSSPLPPNLQMLKSAKLSSRNYLVANNNGEKQYYQVYYVDANNDGNLEYVLTQISLNGTGPSSIVDVFKMNNSTLTLNFLGFNQVAAQSLGFSSPLVACKNWYCNLAQPAFVYEGNAWFMRFKTTTGQICQYLWKNDKLTNQPAIKGCLGSDQNKNTTPNPATVTTLVAP